MSEISQAIAQEILATPELGDTSWDTFSMVAEVTDDSVAITAYRYTESGPPVSTPEPEVDDYLWDLRDLMGGAWDVALVKIQRETGGLVLDFVSGADADRWRITPENMDGLPEAMRPRAEDFAR